MFTQEDFEQLIRNYNEDYLYLLIRASHNSYECLISSFMMLRNLYDVIVKFQDSGSISSGSSPTPSPFGRTTTFSKPWGSMRRESETFTAFLNSSKKRMGKSSRSVWKEASTISVNGTQEISHGE